MSPAVAPVPVITGVVTLVRSSPRVPVSLAEPGSAPPGRRCGGVDGDDERADGSGDVAGRVGLGGGEGMRAIGQRGWW